MRAAASRPVRGLLRESGGEMILLEVLRNGRLAYSLRAEVTGFACGSDGGYGGERTGRERTHGCQGFGLSLWKGGAVIS